jgi:hypothetical protein
MPKQSIAAGKLQGKIQQERKVYGNERIVERLWAKDVSMWPVELLDRNPTLANLGWLE